MQIRKEHWKVCINCDKSYDDDEALYCDKQKECKIIERDKPVHVRVKKTQTQPIQANNKHIKRTGTSWGYRRCKKGLKDIYKEKPIQ